MIKSLFRVVAVAVAVFLPTVAARAEVMSNAKILWDSFNVQLVPLGDGQVDFQWTYAYGSASAYADTAFPGDYQSDGSDILDFTTTLSAGAVTSKAAANALRDSSVLAVSASAQPGTSPNAPDYNSAQALSYVTGNFTITGHGLVYITFGWELEVFGDTGNYNDYSYADVAIWGDYESGASSGNASSGDAVYSSVAGDETRQGTFTMAILSLPGVTTTGSLTAYTTAYAQSFNVVPEPSSFVLMGLGVGLVGWVSYRRRRS